MIDVIEALSVVAILAAALVSGSLLAPYVARVFSRSPSRLDRFLNPLERGFYRTIGVDPDLVMGWRQYFFSALLLNIVQMVIAFIILTTQNLLPLDPQGFPGLRWDLALNTVISFATYISAV